MHFESTKRLLATPLERSLKMAFICRSENLRDNAAMHNARAFLLPTASRTVLGWTWTWALPLAMAMALLGPTPVAHAKDRDKHDHERAQAAVQSGQVLPLRTLLERIAREHPGQVLEVELERDDGVWIYEIKNLQTDGRLVKLEFDAGTGALLKKRERHKP